MVLRYKLMSNTAYQDEVIILKVKDWQTADKYAVCFSRAHGKIPFLAYGARYARTTGGRLIQPFAMLDMQLYSGKRLDSMKSCELIALPQQMDIKQMAYASVIAEVTEALTEAHEPQEDIYELLVGAVQILSRNNPRLVALSAICKLLVLTVLKLLKEMLFLVSFRAALFAKPVTEGKSCPLAAALRSCCRS